MSNIPTPEERRSRPTSHKNEALLVKAVEGLPLLVVTGVEDALAPLKSIQALASKFVNSVSLIAVLHHLRWHGDRQKGISFDFDFKRDEREEMGAAKVKGWKFRGWDDDEKRDLDFGGGRERERGGTYRGDDDYGSQVAVHEGRGGAFCKK
ncbi:hypothetical protein L2E82_20819 [Cichorium intybus]|uniref:Uncharacterized protein n=1 Tax=Cichorium intybus TaxID=13427 RepID=A0ACB9DUU5_CICIN|nr:hypothetical protein L2E82_20819 [Cichorium intybus]